MQKQNKGRLRRAKEENHYQTDQQNLTREEDEQISYECENQGPN